MRGHNGAPSIKEFLRGGVLWIAGGIALGVVALVGLGLLTSWLRGVGGEIPAPDVTLIAYPTPLPPTSTALPATETATPTAAAATPRSSGAAMRVGDYVEVPGTGGDGLRLRAAPSVNASINLLAYDSEVFQIRDGPQDADGHTWYDLVSPSDTSRNGWAVADFLQQSTSP